MTLTVIQERPLIRCKGVYYQVNPGNIEKYIKHCDHLIYCASCFEEYDQQKVSKYTKIDYNNVELCIIKRSVLKDTFYTSVYNKKVMREAIYKADLVVIKIPSITIGPWAFRELKKNSKPFIVEMIACAWDSYWYHSLKGKLLAPYSYLVNRWMVKNAPNVHYVTSQFLQSRYPNDGNAMACSNVMLEAKSAAVLEERLHFISNSVSDTPIKLGTAGGVDVRFKGQQYVIKALGVLKKKGVIMEYYLAGGGSQNYLKRVAEESDVAQQVHFLGAVPRQKMAEFYDSLDVYIHPSLAEGLPRVLIEAESRALPAFGARAAGTPELLNPECVFEKQNVEDIVSHLEHISKEKLLRYAKENFERSKEYDYRVLEERRSRFYNDLVNSNK